MFPGWPFSPDARSVLSVGIDRVFHIWDIFAAKEVRTFSGHSILIFDTSFSRDGSRIISGSEDHTIKIWDAATGRILKTLAGNVSWVYSANFSPDGKQVLSTGEDRTVRLWNIATGRQEDTFRFQWDIAEDKESDSNKQLKSRVKSAVFSKDGKRILSRAEGMNGAIIIWDVSTGKVERFFIDKNLSSPAVQYNFPLMKSTSSPAAKTSCLNSGMSLQGKKSRVYRPQNNIYAVAFSPDGNIRIISWRQSLGRQG